MVASFRSHFKKVSVFREVTKDDMKINVCYLAFRMGNQRRWLHGLSLELNSDGSEKSGMSNVEVEFRQEEVASSIS